MNTEATQDKSAVHSTGERLRLAREQMGLTQQNIAERLCLKLSTVRDIEEDKSPADLASTFLRGYIRSYARLVHVPEDDLLPMMAKQASVRAAKIEPMQSFSLGKHRKKRDGWLMIFTWLVVFVVIGLTGAWWWQNHKASQEDLVSMADQHDSSSDSSQSIPQADNGADKTTQSNNDAAGTSVDNGGVSTAASGNSSIQPVANTNTSAPEASSNNAVVSPSQVTSDTNPPAAQMPTANAAVSQPAGDPNAVVMHFKADCWLEVTDATGKKLFSGLQRSGDKLSLSGKLPYRLKIGAPAAVEVQYQNQPVDLSRFIRNNQVARLTLGAQ